MTAYAMLWIGGGNDLVATQFHVSLNAVTHVLRVAVFVAPVIAFLLTKRICIGLQRADAERLLHGAETGIIERDPSGKYSERHRPISVDEAYTLTQHKEQLALLPPADTDGMSEKEIKSETATPGGDPVLLHRHAAQADPSRARGGRPPPRRRRPRDRGRRGRASRPHLWRGRSPGQVTGIAESAGVS